MAKPSRALHQSSGEAGGRKLALIASKGSLDMDSPPLILANAARMSGIEVEMFFTFWGLDIITKKKMGKLHVATVVIPICTPGSGSQLCWERCRECPPLLPG